MEWIGLKPNPGKRLGIRAVLAFTSLPELHKEATTQIKTKVRGEDIGREANILVRRSTFSTSGQGTNRNQEHI